MTQSTSTVENNNHQEEQLSCKQSDIEQRLLKLASLVQTNDVRLLTVHVQQNSELKKRESPAKRQKTTESICRFSELEKVKVIRRRTFSSWPRRLKTFVERLISAGFFGCNVGDRVICIYCNLICQQWLDLTDDPNEVHQVLSPTCPFVNSILKNPVLSSTIILNDISTSDQQQFNGIVLSKPIHGHYSEVTKRVASFANWSHQAAPSIDDFVRAGFFYTGTNNIVTCFYCNGSLQNWAAMDNPIIEHVRWFSHCPYAKQLCGDELYQRIQQARQERERIQHNNHFKIENQGQLVINDESMLSRLVAARLDLPQSQNLLDNPFKLSIIKRCWEDQLRLKKDDFVSSSDLYTACMILQKQIDHIQGNKDNIIVPSVRMKLLCEGKQQVPIAESNEPAPVPMETKEEEEEEESKDSSTVTNPCIICFQDEKRLACLPCGHFSSCVPCSHSLRTCPVCRQGIEAFVRVYI